MKLTKTQKEIVRDIYAGRIYDITSYLKLKGFCESFKYDKEKILRNFYNVMKGSLPLDTEEENKLFYEFLVENSNVLFDWTGEYISIKGLKRKLDFTKELFLSKQNADFMDYLIVVQYLKQNGMVLEIPKPVSDNDLSVFYFLQIQRAEPFPDPNALSVLENISNHFTDKSFLYEQKALLRKIIIDGQSYCQYHLKQNSEMLAVCEQYIDVKIVPTPKLGFFIQSRYKTLECRLRNRADIFLVLTIAFLIVMAAVLLISIKNMQELSFLIQKLLDK